MPNIKSILKKHMHPRLYSGLKRMHQALTGSEPEQPLAPPSLADLTPLGEPFASTLHSMYRGDPQPGLDGQTHPIDSTTRISIGKGLNLHRLCLDVKARRTMEVGCAYGFSTLYFLSALRSQEGASHVAIDPHENVYWHGIAAQNARAVGMDSAFRLLEESSFTAIPRLVSEGDPFDVIFVDGNHRFDDVLVDFTLSAPICKPGGYIIFDDMWMHSIRKATSFVRRNRKDFAEVKDVAEGTAVFQRIGDDQRDWSHFEDFE
jgi:predicted O-methyltransferase YrrM